MHFEHVLSALRARTDGTPRTESALCGSENFLDARIIVGNDVRRCVVCVEQWCTSGLVSLTLMTPSVMPQPGSLEGATSASLRTTHPCPGPVLWRATARTPQPADTTHTGVLHKLEKQAGQTVVVFIPLLGVHGLASRTAPRCRRAPSRPCSTGATAASTTS